MPDSASIEIIEGLPTEDDDKTEHVCHDNYTEPIGDAMISRKPDVFPQYWRAGGNDNAQDRTAFFITMGNEVHITHDRHLLNFYHDFPQPKKVGLKNTKGLFYYAYGYGDVFFNTPTRSGPLLDVWYVPQSPWNMVALNSGIHTMRNFIFSLEGPTGTGIAIIEGDRTGDVVIPCEFVAGGNAKIVHHGFWMKAEPDMNMLYVG